MQKTGTVEPFTPKLSPGQRLVLETMRQYGRPLIVGPDYAGEEAWAKVDSVHGNPINIPYKAFRSLVDQGCITSADGLGLTVTEYRPVCTTVFNLRGCDHKAVQNDARFAYVGRAQNRLGWKSSIFRNPFKGSDTARAVISYADLIQRQLDTPKPPRGVPSLGYAYAVALKSGLAEIRGKALCCWCCEWDGMYCPSRPCHAVVLARLADGLSALPPAWFRHYRRTLD